MKLGLSEKVVVVTGGGRGIGMVIARSFAGEGAAVVIADIIDENARAVAREIEAGGGKTLALPVAVQDPRQVREMIEAALRRFGRLDVLVNDAAVKSTAPTRELTLETWQETIDVNLTGVFNCCQAALGPMSAQKGGRIVNISSINAFTIVGFADAAYVATKAAVAGLTRKIAQDMAPFGGTCNAVAPSVVFTDMSRAVFERVGAETLAAQVPLGRVCAPEDVANAVVFLASDAAAFITGQVIHVNGGIYT